MAEASSGPDAVSLPCGRRTQLACWSEQDAERSQSRASEETHPYRQQHACQGDFSRRCKSALPGISSDYDRTDGDVSLCAFDGRKNAASDGHSSADPPARSATCDPSVTGDAGVSHGAGHYFSRRLFAARPSSPLLHFQLPPRPRSSVSFSLTTPQPPSSPVCHVSPSDSPAGCFSSPSTCVPAQISRSASASSCPAATTEGHLGHSGGCAPSSRLVPLTTLAASSTLPSVPQLPSAAPLCYRSQPLQLSAAVTSTVGAASSKERSSSLSSIHGYRKSRSLNTGATRISRSGSVDASHEDVSCRQSLSDPIVAADSVLPGGRDSLVEKGMHINAEPCEAGSVRPEKEVLALTSSDPIVAADSVLAGGRDSLVKKDMHVNAEPCEAGSVRPEKEVLAAPSGRKTDIADVERRTIATPSKQKSFTALPLSEEVENEVIPQVAETNLVQKEGEPEEVVKRVSLSRSTSSVLRLSELADKRRSGRSSGSLSSPGDEEGDNAASRGQAQHLPGITSETPRRPTTSTEATGQHAPVAATSCGKPSRDGPAAATACALLSPDSCFLSVSAATEASSPLLSFSHPVSPSPAALVETCVSLPAAAFASGAVELLSPAGAAPAHQLRRPQQSALAFSHASPPASRSPTPPAQICLAAERLLVLKTPWRLPTSAVLKRNNLVDAALYFAVLQNLLQAATLPKLQQQLQHLYLQQLQATAAACHGREETAQLFLPRRRCRLLFELLLSARETADSQQQHGSCRLCSVCPASGNSSASSSPASVSVDVVCHCQPPCSSHCMRASQGPQEERASTKNAATVADNKREVLPTVEGPTPRLLQCSSGEKVRLQGPPHQEDRRSSPQPHDGVQEEQQDVSERRQEPHGAVGNGRQDVWLQQEQWGPVEYQRLHQRHARLPFCTRKYCTSCSRSSLRGEDISKRNVEEDVCQQALHRARLRLQQLLQCHQCSATPSSSPIRSFPVHRSGEDLHAAAAGVLREGTSSCGHWQRRLLRRFVTPPSAATAAEGNLTQSLCAGGLVGFNVLYALARQRQESLASHCRRSEVPDDVCLRPVIDSPLRVAVRTATSSVGRAQEQQHFESSAPEHASVARSSGDFAAGADAPADVPGVVDTTSRLPRPVSSGPATLPLPPLPASPSCFAGLRIRGPQPRQQGEASTESAPAAAPHVSRSTAAADSELRAALRWIFQAAEEVQTAFNAATQYSTFKKMTSRSSTKDSSSSCASVSSLFVSVPTPASSSDIVCSPSCSSSASAAPFSEACEAATTPAVNGQTPDVHVPRPKMQEARAVACRKGRYEAEDVLQLASLFCSPPLFLLWHVSSTSHDAPRCCPLQQRTEAGMHPWPRLPAASKADTTAAHGRSSSSPSKRIRKNSSPQMRVSPVSERRDATAANSGEGPVEDKATALDTICSETSEKSAEECSRSSVFSKSPQELSKSSSGKPVDSSTGDTSSRTGDTNSRTGDTNNRTVDTSGRTGNACNEGTRSAPAVEVEPLQQKRVDAPPYVAYCEKKQQQQLRSGCLGDDSEMFDVFRRQVLWYQTANVGAPSLTLLTRFCASVLYWLLADDKRHFAAINIDPRCGSQAFLLLACAALAVEWYCAKTRNSGDSKSAASPVSNSSSNASSPFSRGGITASSNGSSSSYRSSGTAAGRSSENVSSRSEYTAERNRSSSSSRVQGSSTCSFDSCRLSRSNEARAGGGRRKTAAEVLQQVKAASVAAQECAALDQISCLAPRRPPAGSSSTGTGSVPYAVPPSVRVRRQEGVDRGERQQQRPCLVASGLLHADTQREHATAGGAATWGSATAESTAASTDRGSLVGESCSSSSNATVCSSSDCSRSVSSSRSDLRPNRSSNKAWGVLGWQDPGMWRPSCRRYLQYFERLLYSEPENESEQAEDEGTRQEEAGQQHMQQRTAAAQGISSEASSSTGATVAARRGRGHGAAMKESGVATVRGGVGASRYRVVRQVTFATACTAAAGAAAGAGAAAAAHAEGLSWGADGNALAGQTSVREDEEAERGDAATTAHAGRTAAATEAQGRRPKAAGQPQRVHEGVGKAKVERRTQGISYTPYRLKNIIVENFSPPAELLCVEVYETSLCQGIPLAAGAGVASACRGRSSSRSTTATAARPPVERENFAASTLHAAARTHHRSHLSRKQQVQDSSPASLKPDGAGVASAVYLSSPSLSCSPSSASLSCYGSASASSSNAFSKCASSAASSSSPSASAVATCTSSLPFSLNAPHASAACSILAEKGKIRTPVQERRRHQQVPADVASCSSRSRTGAAAADAEREHLVNENPATLSSDIIPARLGANRCHRGTDTKDTTCSSSPSRCDSYRTACREGSTQAGRSAEGSPGASGVPASSRPRSSNATSHLLGAVSHATAENHFSLSAAATSPQAGSAAGAAERKTQEEDRLENSSSNTQERTTRERRSSGSSSSKKEDRALSPQLRLPDFSKAKDGSSKAPFCRGPSGEPCDLSEEVRELAPRASTTAREAATAVDAAAATTTEPAAPPAETDDMLANTTPERRREPPEATAAGIGGGTEGAARLAATFSSSTSSPLRTRTAATQTKAAADGADVGESAATAGTMLTHRSLHAHPYIRAVRQKELMQSRRGEDGSGDSFYSSNSGASTRVCVGGAGVARRRKEASGSVPLLFESDGPLGHLNLCCLSDQSCAGAALAAEAEVAAALDDPRCRSRLRSSTDIERLLLLQQREHVQAQQQQQQDDEQQQQQQGNTQQPQEVCCRGQESKILRLKGKMCTAGVDGSSSMPERYLYSVQSSSSDMSKYWSGVSTSSDDEQRRGENFVAAGRGRSPAPAALSSADEKTAVLLRSSGAIPALHAVRESHTRRDEFSHPREEHHLQPEEVQQKPVEGHPAADAAACAHGAAPGSAAAAGRAAAADCAAAAGCAAAAATSQSLQQYRGAGPVHERFTLRACVGNYQLMAADTFEGGKTSAVFDFAHNSAGEDQQLIVAGDVVIAFRQLAATPVLRPSIVAGSGDSGGSSSNGGGRWDSSSRIMGSIRGRKNRRGRSCSSSSTGSGSSKGAALQGDFPSEKAAEDVQKTRSEAAKRKEKQEEGEDAGAVEWGTGEQVYATYWFHTGFIEEGESDVQLLTKEDLDIDPLLDRLVPDDVRISLIFEPVSPSRICRPPPRYSLHTDSTQFKQPEVNPRCASSRRPASVSCSTTSTSTAIASAASVVSSLAAAGTPLPSPSCPVRHSAAAEGAIRTDDTNEGQQEPPAAAALFVDARSDRCRDETAARESRTPREALSSAGEAVAVAGSPSSRGGGRAGCAGDTALPPSSSKDGQAAAASGTPERLVDVTKVSAAAAAGLPLPADVFNGELAYAAAAAFPRSPVSNVKCLERSSNSATGGFGSLLSALLPLRWPGTTASATGTRHSRSSSSSSTRRFLWMTAAADEKGAAREKTGTAALAASGVRSMREEHRQLLRRMHEHQLREKTRQQQLAKRQKGSDEDRTHTRIGRAQRDWQHWQPYLLWRVQQVAQRPAPSKREFWRGHVVYANELLLQILLRLSHCSMDECLVALKVSGNDLGDALFFLALQQLLRYSYLQRTRPSGSSTSFDSLFWTAAPAVSAAAGARVLCAPQDSSSHEKHVLSSAMLRHPARPAAVAAPVPAADAGVFGATASTPAAGQYAVLTEAAVPSAAALSAEAAAPAGISRVGRSTAWMPPAPAAAAAHAPYARREAGGGLYRAEQGEAVLGVAGAAAASAGVAAGAAPDLACRRGHFTPGHAAAGGRAGEVTLRSAGEGCSGLYVAEDGKRSSSTDERTAAAVDDRTASPAFNTPTVLPEGVEDSSPVSASLAAAGGLPSGAAATSRSPVLRSVQETRRVREGGDQFLSIENSSRCRSAADTTTAQAKPEKRERNRKMANRDPATDRWAQSSSSRTPSEDAPDVFGAAGEESAAFGRIFEGRSRGSVLAREKEAWDSPAGNGSCVVLEESTALVKQGKDTVAAAETFDYSPVEVTSAGDGEQRGNTKGATTLERRGTTARARAGATTAPAAPAEIAAGEAAVAAMQAPWTVTASVGARAAGKPAEEAMEVTSAAAGPSESGSSQAIVTASAGRQNLVDSQGSPSRQGVSESIQPDAEGHQHGRVLGWREGSQRRQEGCGHYVKGVVLPSLSLEDSSARASTAVPSHPACVREHPGAEQQQQRLTWRRQEERHEVLSLEDKTQTAEVDSETWAAGQRSVLTAARYGVRTDERGGAAGGTEGNVNKAAAGAVTSKTAELARGRADDTESLLQNRNTVGLQPVHGDRRSEKPAAEAAPCCKEFSQEAGAKVKTLSLPQEVEAEGKNAVLRSRETADSLVAVPGGRAPPVDMLPAFSRSGQICAATVEQETRVAARDEGKTRKVVELAGVPSREDTGGAGAATTPAMSAPTAKASDEGAPAAGAAALTQVATAAGRAAGTSRAPAERGSSGKRRDNAGILGEAPEEHWLPSLPAATPATSTWAATTASFSSLQRSDADSGGSASAGQSETQACSEASARVAAGASCRGGLAQSGRSPTGFTDLEVVVDSVVSAGEQEAGNDSSGPSEKRAFFCAEGAESSPALPAGAVNIPVDFQSVGSAAVDTTSRATASVVAGNIVPSANTVEAGLEVSIEPPTGHLPTAAIAAASAAPRAGAGAAAEGHSLLEGPQKEQCPSQAPYTAGDAAHLDSAGEWVTSGFSVSLPPAAETSQEPTEATNVTEKNARAATHVALAGAELQAGGDSCVRRSGGAAMPRLQSAGKTRVEDGDTAAGLQSGGSADARTAGAARVAQGSLPAALVEEEAAAGSSDSGGVRGRQYIIKLPTGGVLQISVDSAGETHGDAVNEAILAAAAGAIRAAAAVNRIGVAAASSAGPIATRRSEMSNEAPLRLKLDCTTEEGAVGEDAPGETDLAALAVKSAAAGVPAGGGAPAGEPATGDVAPAGISGRERQAGGAVEQAATAPAASLGTSAAVTVGEHFAAGLRGTFVTSEAVVAATGGSPAAGTRPAKAGEEVAAPEGAQGTEATAAKAVATAAPAAAALPAAAPLADASAAAASAAAVSATGAPAAAASAAAASAASGVAPELDLTQEGNSGTVRAPLPTRGVGTREDVRKVESETTKSAKADKAKGQMFRSDATAAVADVLVEGFAGAGDQEGVPVEADRAATVGEAVAQKAAEAGRREQRPRSTYEDLHCDVDDPVRNELFSMREVKAASETLSSATVRAEEAAGRDLLLELEDAGTQQQQPSEVPVAAGYERQRYLQDREGLTAGVVGCPQDFAFVTRQKQDTSKVDDVPGSAARSTERRRTERLVAGTARVAPPETPSLSKKVGVEERAEDALGEEVHCRPTNTDRRASGRDESRGEGIATSKKRVVGEGGNSFVNAGCGDAATAGNIIEESVIPSASAAGGTDARSTERGYMETAEAAVAGRERTGVRQEPAEAGPRQKENGGESFAERQTASFSSSAPSQPTATAATAPRSDEETGRVGERMEEATDIERVKRMNKEGAIPAGPHSKSWAGPLPAKTQPAPCPETVLDAGGRASLPQREQQKEHERIQPEQDLRQSDPQQQVGERKRRELEQQKLEELEKQERDPPASQQVVRQQTPRTPEEQQTTSSHAQQAKQETDGDKEKPVGGAAAGDKKQERAKTADDGPEKRDSKELTEGKETQKSESKQSPTEEEKIFSLSKAAAVPKGPKRPPPPPPPKKALCPPKRSGPGLPPPPPLLAGLLKMTPMSKKAPSVKKKSGEVLPLGRKIHWKPLDEDKIEGTVFSEMAPTATLPGLNAASLTRLFSKTRVPSAAAPEKAKKRGLVGAEENTHKILDSRRAQNIAIVLARLPFSTEELAMKLRLISTEDMNLDLLQKVELVLPTPEETAEFREYLKKASESADSVLPLRDVEAKLLPLIPLSRLTNKTRIMKTSLNAPKVIEEMNTSLRLLSRAADEARESNKFRVVLQAVLQWGNYVNHGYQMAGAAREVDASASTVTGPNDTAGEEKKIASDGQTASGGTPAEREGVGKALPIRGFTLPSLLKLMEFKTAVDPSMTSLHFILVNLMATLPDLNLQDLPKDMPSVDAAARVSEEAVDALAGYLISEASFIAMQIRQLETNGDPVMTKEETTIEVQRLHRLHGEMVFAVEDLRQKYEDCKAKVADLGRFYGDEPKNADATVAKKSACSLKKAASTPFIPAAGSDQGDGKAQGAGGSATNAGGPPALRQWEGGLLEFSPFETLAAILKHFRHTLRELQVNPRKYLVLLVGERTEIQKNSLLKSRFGQVSARSTENNSRGAAADRKTVPPPRTRTVAVKCIASAPLHPQPHQAKQEEARGTAEESDGYEAVLGTQKTKEDELSKFIAGKAAVATGTAVGGSTIQPAAVDLSKQRHEAKSVCRLNSDGETRGAARVYTADGITGDERTVGLLVDLQQDNKGDSKNITVDSGRGISVDSTVSQHPAVRAQEREIADNGFRPHEGYNAGGHPQEKVPHCVFVPSASVRTSASVHAGTSDVCERAIGEDACTPLTGSRPKTKTEATSQQATNPRLPAQRENRSRGTEHELVAFGGAPSQRRTEAQNTVLEAGTSRCLVGHESEGAGACTAVPTSWVQDAPVDRLKGKISTAKEVISQKQEKMEIFEQTTEKTGSAQWKTVAPHAELPTTSNTAKASSSEAPMPYVDADTRAEGCLYGSASTLTKNMPCDTYVFREALGVPPSSVKSLDSSFQSCESAKEAEDSPANALHTTGEFARSEERRTGIRTDKELHLLQLPRSAVPEMRTKERSASEARVRSERDSAEQHWLEALAFSPSAAESGFPRPKSSSNASLSPLEGLQPAFSNMALAASIDKALFARSPLHQKECSSRLNSEEASTAHRLRTQVAAMSTSPLEKSEISCHLRSRNVDGKPCGPQIDNVTVQKAACTPLSAAVVKDLRADTVTRGTSTSSLFNRAIHQGEAAKVEAALQCRGEVDAATLRQAMKDHHLGDEVQEIAGSPIAVGWPLSLDRVDTGYKEKVDADTGHVSSACSQSSARGEQIEGQTQTTEVGPVVASALLCNTIRGDPVSAVVPHKIEGALPGLAVDIPQMKGDSTTVGGEVQSGDQTRKTDKRSSCSQEGYSSMNLPEVKLRPSTPLFSWNSTGAMVGHAAGERAAPTKQRRIRCRLRQPPPPIPTLRPTRRNNGTSEPAVKVTHKAGVVESVRTHAGSENGL